MSEQTGQDWQRLARLVIARRVQLGHRTQARFSEASGIKIRTLNNIENARRTGYDPSTIALLEQGLDWSPGSVDAVLDGNDPVRVDTAGSSEQEDLAKLALKAPADTINNIIRDLRALQLRGQAAEERDELVGLLDALLSDKLRAEVHGYIEGRRRQA